MIAAVAFPAALLLLVLSSLIPQSAHAESDLATKIEQAEALAITDPAGAGLDLVNQLMTELDQATPRQRATVRLLALRLTALDGQVEQALGEAEALLAGDLAPDQRLSALRLTANLALNAGNMQSAFGYLAEAIALLDDEAADDDKVAVFGLASWFHSQAGDAWLALDYAQKGLDSARHSGNQRLQCTALGWMAHAQFAHEDHAAALAAGEQARSYCSVSGDRITEGWIDTLLARLALRAGELDYAGELIDQALALHADSYHDGRLNSELLQARLLLRQQRPDEALDLASRLIDYLQTRDRADWLADALDVAAQAAEQLGRLPEAMDFYRRHVDARERHLDHVQSMRMAQLAVDFDQRQQQREFDLLRERQRTAELAATQKAQIDSLRGWALIAGLLLAALLVIMLLQAQRERRHFRSLSRHDGLTRLLNHTHFFEQIERDLLRTEKARQPLSFVLIDIDHFKQVNDRFGHQIGDEVLRQTAQVLREIFQDHGTVGRIGGEEFAVSLPGSDLRRALALVESLRQRLAGRARRPTDPPITLSFGVGCRFERESMESLRRRTDQALYAAKRAGRNQVQMAE